MKKFSEKSSSWQYAGWFALAIVLGILNGLFPTELGLTATATKYPLSKKTLDFS